MALHAAKGKLIGVIGDEVTRIWHVLSEKRRVLELGWLFLQDTCVGFLLGGVGEINKNRQANFMVVDKSKEERIGRRNGFSRFTFSFLLLLSVYRHCLDRVGGLLEEVHPAGRH